MYSLYCSITQTHVVLILKFSCNIKTKPKLLISDAYSSIP